MNADTFAEWLRRQGHHVIHTTSTYWHDQGPRVYQAFPYHWTITPSKDELRGFLLKNRVVGLRYSAPHDAPTGVISYHVVYTDKSYEQAELPKKARHDVRKGLGHVNISPIPLDRLAVEGWQIRHETLLRQGRNGAETAQWWRTLCLSGEGLPGVEAWGAIHENQLVAALLTFTCDEYFNILYQLSATDHLKFGVNNALTYVVTQEALSRPGISQIFYGLHSLDAPDSVDRYKFRMNYTARPVRQRVVFHPWIAPAFNRTTHAAVKRLASHWPGSGTLGKVEGMIRFYRQGQLPPDRQSQPPALRQG